MTAGSDDRHYIAEGYDADILAVRGDPLVDHGALHRIAAVYSRGRLIGD